MTGDNWIGCSKINIFQMGQLEDIRSSLVNNSFYLDHIIRENDNNNRVYQGESILN